VINCSNVLIKQSGDLTFGSVLCRTSLSVIEGALLIPL
jgi:hypothetical protein